MAGFEVVVRPVVFPNIRPTPARSLAPDDDPAKDVATIGGSSGHIITLTFTSSYQSNTPQPTEARRRVDKVRTYQEDPETGEKNNDNYIDTDVANRITMQNDRGRLTDYYYKPAQESKTVEIRRRNVIE